MKNGLKHLVVIFLSALIYSQACFAGLWEDVERAIQNRRVQPSFSEIIKALPLITSQFTLDDPIQPSKITVAGGYLVITQQNLQSFAQIGAEKPEFEYALNHPVQKKYQSTGIPKKDLSGVRVALDVGPDGQNYKQIGALPYSEFMTFLQDGLARELRKFDAQVEYFRPNNPLSQEFQDKVNQDPVDIVVSLNFNNDKQDCMTTFCGGNIMQKEFGRDRDRARFIMSLFTGKSLHSVQLGACVSEHCRIKLGVAPMTDVQKRFDGNAAPVSVYSVPGLKLQVLDGSYAGISTRNLAWNHIFAQAFVNPFPDMQWVREQVKGGKEKEFIDYYSQALAGAVLEFVRDKSELFWQ